jgi:hypothetical protein
VTAPSFTCPRCHATSYNPNDVREGYCGNCHDRTGVPRGPAAKPTRVDRRGGPQLAPPGMVSVSVSHPEVVERITYGGVEVWPGGRPG